MSEGAIEPTTTDSIGVLEEIRFEDGREVRYIRRHKDGKVLRYMQRKDGSWGVPARHPKAQFSAKRLVNAKPSAIFDELQQSCPWLYTIDRQAIDRFIDVESRRRVLTERLQQMLDEGMLLEDIKTAFWNALRDAEMNSYKIAQDLGLDPTGRQKLLKDAAWAKRLATESVNEVAARGQEYRRLKAIE